MRPTLPAGPCGAALSLRFLPPIAVAILLMVWNEFPIALMLTTSDARTLPIAASELSQLGFETPWGIPNASIIVLSLPPLMFLGILSGFLNSFFK